MTTAIPQHLDLEQRLTELLGTRDVHPDDRAAIQDAYMLAPTWEQLPQAIRDKVEELEKLPRQSWDDPFDVPDQLD